MSEALPAYILGVEHPRGIACARSLARRGIPVVSVDYRLSSSAAPYTCRYFARREVVDPTNADAVRALESLADERGGVLIPTNDEYLIFVARHHARLSRTFHLACPSWQQLESVMDRARCVELAKRAGLKTPRTFSPKDERELDDILPLLDFGTQRYVLKLELWTDSVAETKLRRKTTYGGATPQELRTRALEIARRTGEFPTVQELVPGSTDASIGVTLVVGRDVDVCVQYCVRRLKLQTYSEVDDFHHPYDLGGNVFCETVHDPEAIAQARRFVHAVGWVGVVTVEFRRDARDGSLIFVKVDPRVVRSTSLSTAIGMDVPAAIYDIALGRPPATRVQPYRAGICWIWLDNYFECLWRNRRHASTRRELLKLIERWRDIRAFAYWDARDPLPFLTQSALRFTWARGWSRPKRLAELTRFRRSLSSAATPNA